MKNKILDLIDFKKVDTLLEGFNKSTGFTTAILDLDGNVLSKSGWRQICTEFHRINPETSKKCTISDTLLAGKMEEGEKFHFYKCLNGLIDVAVPIEINGEHIANLFSGQFFFEEPDRNIFIKQAKKLGFNEEKYLEALEKVPVVSKEKVLATMDFLMNMTQLISETTFQKLEQIELTDSIIRSEEKWAQSYELLTNLASLVPGVIYQYRLYPDGSSAFPYSSPGMYGIYEVTPEQVREDATPVFGRLHPEDADRVSNSIFESARTLEEFYCEFRVILPEQGLRWRWSQAHPERTEDGGTLWHGIISDITEGKQAEIALRESERHLKNSQQIAHIGSWQLDLATNQVLWTEELYHMYGFDPTLPPPPFTEHMKLFTPASWERLSASLANIRETGIPYVLELETVRVDGSNGWMWVRGEATKDSDGNTIGLWGAAQDITERKQTEIALRESEELFSLFLKHSPIYAFIKAVTPSESRILKVSDNYQGMLDIPASDMVGKTMAELFPADLAAKITADDWTVVSSGVVLRLDEDLNGRNYSSIKFPITLGDKTLLAGYTIDITERKQAEVALRESEERFRRAVIGAPIPIMIHAEDGQVITINTPWTQLTGYELSDIPTIADWTRKAYGDQKDLVREHIDHLYTLDGPEVGDEHTITTNSGEERIWDFSSAPIGQLPDGRRLVISMAMDVTERKQTEIALRESEELFSLFLKHSPIYAFIKAVTPSESRILKVSDNYQGMLDIPASDMVGKTMAELFPADLAAKITADDWTVVSSGVVLRLDEDLNGRNYSSIKFPITLGDKTLLAGYTIDITERKQAENTLRESEENFRRAVMSAPIPIMIQAGDGQVITINTPWTQLTGYELSDIPTIADWTRKAYGDQMDSVLEDIEQVYLLDGPKHEGEYTITTSSGEKRVWDYSSSPIGKLPDGRALIITMAMDVTERKNVEAERQKFFQMTESSSEFIGMCDLNMNPLYVNPAGQRLVGLPDMAAACQVKVQDYFFPEDQRFIVEEFFPRLLREGHGDVEIRLRHFLSGEPIWMNYYGFSVRDASGKVVGWATVSRDITERKRMLEELEQLNTELEQKVLMRTALLEASNKELEAFSYSVSHDLRAPLRHAGGYVELLINQFGDGLPEKAGHFLNMINGSTKQMETLIDDLLQYSRIGRQEIKWLESDMDAIVKEVIKMVEPKTSDRKIIWTVADLPQVMGDPILLKHVWANLLENAVKFTRNKATAKIKVSCTRENKHWVFSVKDNGAGFDMSYAQKLFGVFQRLHSSAQYEGTGIGLANVQRIILKHGGRVWAEAQLNKGATFYFTIPHDKI